MEYSVLLMHLFDLPQNAAVERLILGHHYQRRSRIAIVLH